MGALTPVITGALISQGTQILTNQVLGDPRGRAEDNALKQLQQRQSLQEQQRAADAALEREQIAFDTREAESKRKDALRRAVSRQRANFGAQGIGSGAGSSQAVLLGLFEESEDERRRRAELDGLRTAALDQDLAQNRSLNVLQRTQLAERNKLNTISASRQIAGDIVQETGNTLF